jgi:hypothetical protein
MIVLPIESSEEDDTPQEWSLLELNGELLPAKKEAKGDHMELGSIKFDAKVMNNIQLISFPSDEIFTCNVHNLKLFLLSCRYFVGNQCNDNNCIS